MNDPHPRYVIREITGYSLRHGGKQLAHTSVWVADTWDCCREAATFYTSRKLGNPPYVKRRAAAERRCAELNAEHDTWLAAG